MADKKAAPKTKPLASLRSKSKGEVDHVRIYPAKNSAGKLAFRTEVHRKHPAAAEEEMRKTGRYMPDPKPDETVHEDGEDMLDHVGRTYGIQHSPDGDEDEDDE